MVVKADDTISSPCTSNKDIITPIWNKQDLPTISYLNRVVYGPKIIYVVTGKCIRETMKQETFMANCLMDDLEVFLQQELEYGVSNAPTLAKDKLIVTEGVCRAKKKILFVKPATSFTTLILMEVFMLTHHNLTTEVNKAHV